MLVGNDIFSEDVGNITTLNLASDLPENSLIYVTITPYNAQGNATSCSEESFTTETLPTIPSCTTLSTPTNTATAVPVGVDLTWNAAATATGYSITVGTSADGNDIFSEDVGNVTSLNLAADLPENSLIYVTITPYNTQGNAIKCFEASFTTEIAPTPPSCTTLTSPTNAATNISIDTDLSWNAVSNADGYRLSVGTSAGGNNIVNNEDVANMTDYVFANQLPEGATIYVSVIPYNNTGNAIGCNEESFTTIAPVPSCTTLSFPENETTNVSIATDISWNEVTNADGYRLSLGTVSGGTDILNNQEMATSTNFGFENEYPYETIIYVTITPYNLQGEATGCIEQMFTTIERPLDESLYGFSPDGDGINEFWEIKGIENSPDNLVTIYNRWGDAIFQIDSYDNNSNVFRGEANQLTKMGAGNLPAGTYFFDIQINGEHTLKN